MRFHEREENLLCPRVFRCHFPEHFLLPCVPAELSNVHGWSDLEFLNPARLNSVRLGRCPWIS